MNSEMKANWEDVEVLIIGAGTMGASIAQAYAQSGFTVGILDIKEEILDAAIETIDAELNAVKGRVFSEGQIQAIKNRILTTTSYEQACSGPALKLVIESATERLDVKGEIFKSLDRVCAPDVVFASNSSSLDIDAIAQMTDRPDKVVWMHYFYLPHKNRAGEFAGASSATERSKSLAEYYLKLAGKIPTPILSSRRGGAADIVFVSLLLEAVRMLEEGYEISYVEAAGKKAYNMPAGFLTLMDMTGLEVGYYSMVSFSESTGPDDELVSVYKNFFTPPDIYAKLITKYRKSIEKDDVRWVSKNALTVEPEDGQLVDELRDRFLAVGFMTSSEVVDSEVITFDDFEQLAQNAFLWKTGPFTLMNQIGTKKAFELVVKRAKQAQDQKIHFPVPHNLKQLAKENKPWPLSTSPILYRSEKNGEVARILLSKPKVANALDNDVFNELQAKFERAYDDPGVKVVVFDTAPIKTFIAGANVPDFVKRIKGDQFGQILEDTRMWQDVMFHTMTGRGKPKIAVVDGQCFGGGVELAMAFAADPNTIVVATDRTMYALPETRLGIYPGLRGTMMLAQLIYRSTGDAELAVALARYYILAAGTTISSAGMIHYYSLADLVVPAHRREEAVNNISRAIIENDGEMLSQESIRKLNIEMINPELTFEDTEEIRVMKDLFLQPDLIPTLYAYARNWKDPFVAGEYGKLVTRVARRVYFSSPNATFTANKLISEGFDAFLRGEEKDLIAANELENLVNVFRHPDALEGLSAMLEGRFPTFNRTYPF